MKKSGFTLIEVVISILILGLAVGSFLYSFSLHVCFNDQNNSMFLATNAAFSKLEELRGLKRLGTTDCSEAKPDTLLYYNCTNKPEHKFKVDGLKKIIFVPAVRGASAIGLLETFGPKSAYAQRPTEDTYKVDLNVGEIFVSLIPDALADRLASVKIQIEWTNNMNKLNVFETTSTFCIFEDVVSTRLPSPSTP